MQQQLNIMDNGSEIVEYDTPHLAIRSRASRLSYFQNRAATCHWHQDWEWVWVLSGHMYYFVDGETYTLEAGHGIFVNSNRLHYGYGDEEDCEFRVLLLSPSLLVRNTYMEEQYIRPFIEDQYTGALLLDTQTHWKRQVLKQLNELYEICQQRQDGYEWMALSRYELLFWELYRNTIAQYGSHRGHSRDMEAVKQMLAYIQQHFAESVQLHHIAAAGSVSRSKCCALFKQSLHKTPIEYLNSYRLQKSIDYMNNAQLNITEIAAASGFNSSAYYAELFKKQIGVSPLEYRKQRQR